MCHLQRLCLAVIATLAIALFGFGCKSSQSTDAAANSDHPTAEHPNGEHPNGEHPSDHPG